MKTFNIISCYGILLLVATFCNAQGDDDEGPSQEQTQMKELLKMFQQQQKLQQTTPQPGKQQQQMGKQQEQWPQTQQKWLHMIKFWPQQQQWAAQKLGVQQQWPMGQKQVWPSSGNAVNPNTSSDWLLRYLLLQSEQ